MNRERRAREGIAGTIIGFLILAAAACLLLGVLSCGGDGPSHMPGPTAPEGPESPTAPTAVHSASVDARIDRINARQVHVRYTFADWYYYVDLTNTGNQSYDRALILYRFTYRDETRTTSTGREVVNWQPGQTKQIEFRLRFSQKSNTTGDEVLTGPEARYAEDIYHARVITPPKIEFLFRPGSLWGPVHLAEGTVPIPDSVGTWSPGNLFGD